LPGGLVNTGTILDRSLLVITAYNLNGTNFAATIQGYAGHNYQLQYCDDVVGNTWLNAGPPVAGANAPIELTHTASPAMQQRLYRVAVNP
jgi:hypothetical protein